MMAVIPPLVCEMARVAPVEVAVCLSLSTGRGATDLRLTRNPGAGLEHAAAPATQTEKGRSIETVDVCI